MEVKKIQEIREILRKVGLEAAIEQAQLKIDDQLQLNEIDIIAVRLDELKRDEMKGILRREEIEISKNKLIEEFISLLQRIEDFINGAKDWIKINYLNSVPSSPTLFIGREEKMKELETSLGGEKPVLLLNGLGGIGKTALAIEFVNKKIGNYKHIAWISVDTDEGVDSNRGNSIDAIANDIKLIRNLKLEIDPQAKPIDKVKTIFSEMDALDGPNLLVLDNAGSSLGKLIKFLPKSPKWQILITSRQRIGNFKPVVLDELTEIESLELFFSIYPEGKNQEHAVKELLERIGRHTLTLELFANTCEQYEHVDPAYILKTLKNNEFEKLSEEAWADKAEKEVKIYSYLLTVLSIAKLEEKEKKQLIGWSVLPSIPIEWGLIKQIFQVDDDAEFSKILRKLWKKGWLIRSEASKSYRCHQMIQEIIRKQSDSLEKDCEMVIDGVINLLSIDDPNDNPVDKFPFVIYGDNLLSHIESEKNEIAVLQNNLALVYKALSAYEKAAKLLEKALALDLKSLGEEHPIVATRRSNLALIYKDLGSYEKATELLKKAFASDLERFGGEHPIVAIRRSNLALAYHALGAYEEAAELLEKALASDLKSFGEEHPRIATRLSNLALAYQDLGAYEKAAALLEKALASNLKNFGDDHPKTSTVRSNLATVYQDLGAYEKAVELLEKALATELQIFGEEHPNTARSRSNLALVSKDLGDYEKAAELLEKSLEFYSESLGFDHPKTSTVRSNLATVYQDLEAYEKAAELLEKALATELQIFGEEHPNTARSRSNLALVYQDLGAYEKAAELLEKSLEFYSESLGFEHPNTLTICSNLAAVYKDMRVYEKAADLLRIVLPSAIENFGYEHSKTSTIRSNLVDVYQAQVDVYRTQLDVKGYNKMAAKEFKDLEAKYLKLWGEGSLIVANTRSYLARLYMRLGAYEEAAELFEKSLVSYLKSFGADHRDTARNFSNLGFVYYKLKRVEKAKELLEKAHHTFLNLRGPFHIDTITAKYRLDKLS